MLLLQDSLDVRQKESMKTVEMGSLEVKKQRLLYLRCMNAVDTLEGVDEVPACAKGDDTDCLDINATPAAVENGPLVLRGAFEDTALEAKVGAAGVYPEADCVPGVEAKAV